MYWPTACLKPSPRGKSSPTRAVPKDIRVCISKSARSWTWARLLEERRVLRDPEVALRLERRVEQPPRPTCLARLSRPKRRLLRIAPIRAEVAAPLLAALHPGAAHRVEMVCGGSLGGHQFASGWGQPQLLRLDVLRLIRVVQSASRRSLSANGLRQQGPTGMFAPGDSTRRAVDQVRAIGLEQSRQLNRLG